MGLYGLGCIPVYGLIRYMGLYRPVHRLYTGDMGLYAIRACTGLCTGLHTPYMACIAYIGLYIGDMGLYRYTRYIPYTA